MKFFGQEPEEDMERNFPRSWREAHDGVLSGGYEQGDGEDAAPLGFAGREAREEIHRIGEKEISRAAEILQKYKEGKALLEQRIVDDELWWELRHWEVVRKKRHGGAMEPDPSSAWLFNAILNKHADAMDNYPEPVVLPRERSDEESAQALSQVLPAVMECNNFEEVYAAAWWEKLKHGTAAYGVFWDPRKENGLGDVDVRGIDLLKLFWEPGITDIQMSRNLFIVDLVDEELLEAQYPEHRGKLGGDVIDVKQYVYDDTVDTTGKRVVVDWYYKAPAPGGRTVLHYAKFVGNTLLYASENDPRYQDRGWYEDGQYPVVLDTLFPEKGTPVGFGYVAICKDPQLYIDKLSANILESSMLATKKRFFVSSGTAVNEKEFLDWSKPIVHVEGDLDERRMQEIVMQPLPAVYLNVLNMKIDEMKDTAANRDVNSGGAGSGVTAAAAIAALQEAGNKVSRDMIAASFRAYVQINTMVIERMAQFYDETRVFRVTQPEGYGFVEFSNAGIGEQELGQGADGAPLFRKPVFDLKIRAQRKNPFSRMEQNERAKELYAAGFFNPDRAQEAMGALEMMEFEGIDKVREYVQQGSTLMNMVRQLSAQVEQLTGILGALTGAPMAGGPVAPGGGPAVPAGGPAGAAAAGQSASGGITDAVMKANAPMTGYGQRLAKRSTPEVTGS